MVDTAKRCYNSRVEEFREREYPMLKDSVYLDHSGSTLCSKSLIERFSAEMMSNLLGNPHSASPSSQFTASRIEDIRLKLLNFFNADPDSFDLVFVSNATAGIKLVSEAFRALPGGFSFAYHQACHTSIIGVREEARGNACVTNDNVQSWISGELPSSLGDPGPHTLFAYTAQSHMDGRRYSLTWPSLLRQSPTGSQTRVFTLLDAASFVATTPLDLSNSETAPDFTVLSFYKIFGFPDLGALIVRKQAEPIFNHRRYFGGGTVDMVICGQEKWHSPKSTFLHERLEDGTLPFHNILALDAALDVHAELFGSIACVASHTSFLTARLYDGLADLKHGNGKSVCTIYSQPSNEISDSEESGPILSFNVRDSTGAWVSLHEFEKLATLKNLHIRTGGLCSPGGIASALGLSPWEMRNNFSSGFRCGTDQDIVAGKPTGVIRASLGAMSTLSDVVFLINFVKEFYREEVITTSVHHAAISASSAELQVQSISVYPIKSCGGYYVPSGTAWEVKPEGLAWDREWCLVHQGSGQALSQKRYPKMALITPVLDFQSGLLRVTYRGDKASHLPDEISVPLSADPRQFETLSSPSTRSSRVCGDAVTTYVYGSPLVNDFFSAILGVPCVLARFPAGGQGLGMRHSKAKVQKHQQVKVAAPNTCPGAFPELPSPPDSDSEQPAGKILLSNESPILMINSASLHALNREVEANGGRPVPPESFRANLVIGSARNSEQPAWAEDSWESLTIGEEDFKMMGACRRCQMVCVDQETSERHQEPFVTLAKVRRFDGKVYFGTHMGHEPKAKAVTEREQFPTIRVGDAISVNARALSSD
ncbi:MOSC N-terminal beta barrel domain-containing protein [Colletotrichum graminicola]|uniref:Molybdenum cofactor sulfurase n=1 Tax=Colletotrichum graminicola (strain M1.001 / M2 / FGSC 10212) TaxID=645133 RepID=E3Q6L2_COLGM|nr:MOSC N-terminal beta barrel domain-containing protein [Colletotrichum graminicola M1.001]EFQ26460.1 MOSC N-terminal beta barrel domain-containing protein [Colletotrichum graminicola M1.001]WDK14330.1 MOSC N-terminal beta barrel domain-containing protein [Colletotrichum graminicola]